MAKNKRQLLSLCTKMALSCAMLSCCNALIAQTKNNDDPFESYNRMVFKLNDALDTHVLKPIAQGYNAVIPLPARNSINHFYENINTIPVIINDVLQANFYQATSDTWRFFINSTAGLLGFFDVASHIGLEPNREEDLGLTFAQWGWRHSPYFIIPLIGPSTVRDTVAKPIEHQYMTLYLYISSQTDMYLLYAGSVVNARAQLLKLENVMKQAAIDKYAFQRNAYLQHRAYLMQRNHELSNPYLMENEDFEQGDEQSMV